jgi:hypothetical protein
MSNKSTLFAALVAFANEAKSKDNPQSQSQADRFVGYGNPDSDILIVANDTDFFSGISKDANALKVQNPAHWETFLANGAADKKISKTPEGYLNPQKPLKDLPFNRGNGKTLNSFQRIFHSAELVDSYQGPLTFLDLAFYVDFSIVPTRNSASKIISIPEARREILSHPFFQKFKLVILAIGRELMDQDVIWLKNNFNLDQSDDWDKSEPDLITFKQTLFVYTGSGKQAGKTVIHTRKMSGGSSNDFFVQLGKVIADAL